MDSFKGFPSRAKLTALPGTFFTFLLNRIDGIEELKVTLAALYLMAEKRARPFFVTLNELSASDLLKDLNQEQYNTGLNNAVQRGTLLHLKIERNGRNHSFYFLNSEPERKALENIRQGKVSSGSLVEKALLRSEKNIFVLYEENIGQLTPMIVEELREAEKSYPAEWIEEAFGEAVALNNRSWRYISRILERWTVEGKIGKTGRFTEKKFGPQDYFKGKYGRIVRGQKR